MLKPKIVQQEKKIMLGKHAEMSLANDGTVSLWKSFGPRIKEIPHRVGGLLYSINIYPKSFVDSGHDLHTLFTKWAAVEVSKVDLIEGLTEFIIPEGTYAVFIHKGTEQDFPKTLSLIYNEWLPNSDYKLSDRPHYERLTPGYNPQDPEHEEEIWIPIEKA